MNDSDVINWFEVSAIIVFAIIAIAFIYTFVWAIREGCKRDVLNFGLIGLSILGTPFIAAAFVASAKKDTDRLIIEYENQTGVNKKSSLTYWMKLKLNISSIRKVEDINEYCRFCNTHFSNNERKCNNCGEKRVWFIIITYNKNRKINELIEIKDLPKIKGDYKINGIKRQKHPLTHK